jgi:flagellar basal-body rod protein FlgB
MSEFSDALSVSASGLKAQSQRLRHVAENIANADTPGYHARDYDFHRIMQSIEGVEEGLPLARTNPMHLAIEKEPDTLYYRIPFSPAVDGNTVDPDLERQNFLENSLGYMSTLRFLEGDMQGLMTAIKGT